MGILSSPTPPSAGPHGKEIGGTPPQSPSVSTALSGTGYEGLHVSRINCHLLILTTFHAFLAPRVLAVK